MTSEDIRNRKWTEAEKQAVRRLAAGQAAGDDSGIDYSDIPRLTPEQLAGMVRFLDVRRKVPVIVRLDPASSNGSAPKAKATSPASTTSS